MLIILLFPFLQIPVVRDWAGVALDPVGKGLTLDPDVCSGRSTLLNKRPQSRRRCGHHVVGEIWRNRGAGHHGPCAQPKWQGAGRLTVFWGVVSPGTGWGTLVRKGFRFFKKFFSTPKKKKGKN